MSVQVASSLSIHLLGTMTVEQYGVPLGGFRTQKSKWLLALLILRQGKSMEYEALGSLLWPGTGSEQAAASVRQCVRNLTTLLGNARIRKSSRSEVSLDLTQAYVDIFAFDAATRHRDLASLQEVVRLYTGDLLEGYSEEWILPERERRRQAYQEALDLLIEQTQAGGDDEAAERYLRLAIAAEGFKESRRCSLMRLLARRGEHNAALEVYHQFRSLLPDPHAEPGPEMTRLWRDIRESAARAKARPPSSASHSSAYYIPSPIRALVGRQKAITEVAALFTLGRLVTLKGPPGIGKTQMALHVANHLRENFPDGTIFVDLTDAKGATAVWRILSSGLKLPGQPCHSVEEAVVEYTATKQMLLVLDNCEQLVISSASAVKELLHSCPYLRILSTSRMAWGIHPGERVYTVTPLTLPSAALLRHLPADPLPELSEFTAIRLFVERATESSPAFALTSGTAWTVAQICHRLDGLPLALQLAAGWIQTLTPEQILMHISEQLDILRDTRQHSTLRHSRLQTTLEASYQLLPPGLQSLFRQLSVFRNGWLVESADALCETPNILDSLRELQERSLVEAELQGGVMRFRLLETLRHYGENLLARSAEAVAMRCQHLDHFLQLAELAEPDLIGVRQEATVTRLDSEFANLTAALDWAYERHETEKGLRLAGAIWRFWHLRGHYREGLSCLERLLRQKQPVSVPIRSKALNAAGNLAYQSKEYARAHTLFQERLEIEQLQGDRKALAGTLGGLANVASALGDYGQARALFERSLAYFRDMEDSRGTVMTLGNLAVVSCQEGDLSGACTYHEECVAFFRAADDRHSLAVALNNTAGIRIALGEAAIAAPLLKESLEISRNLESRHSLLHGLTLSFFLLTEQGCYERAAALLGANEAFRERTQLPLPEQILEEHRQYEARVRGGLNEQEFERACATGNLMTLNEAVALASATDNLFD